MIPEDKEKFITNGVYWSPAEDKIVALLRDDIDLNLSIKDISEGLFNRSKSAVAGRLLILRREKVIL